MEQVRRTPREPATAPTMEKNAMKTKDGIRPVTEAVYLALLLDVWPSPAGVQDFGLATADHLGALQWAVKADGVTKEQLDQALGKGPALQALISPNNPYRGVVFRTAWDDLLKQPENI